MMNNSFSDFKRNASRLSPILNIGKNGITDPLVEEVRQQLKRNKLIKVKILKTALADKDRWELAAELSSRTGSVLIELKGNRAVLCLK